MDSKEYRYLTNTHNGDNKFWECTLKDKTFTVHFGGIGKTHSQKRSRTFATLKEAQEHMEKVVAQKLARDYKIISLTPPDKKLPLGSDSKGDTVGSGAASGTGEDSSEEEFVKK